MSEGKSSLGASAAVSAAPEEDPDYILKSRPYGGGISTSVVNTIFQLYTFLSMIKNSSNFLSNAPCACCNGNAPYISKGKQEITQFNHHITVCQTCQASICYGCTEFMTYYSCASKKRCRWCGTHVVPLYKIDLSGPLPSYFKELRRARERFYALSMWKSSITLYHRDFNFSGIFWASYFNQKGWRFYVDAEWFFNERLPNEYNIVMARMLILNSKIVSKSLHQNFCDSYGSLHARPDASLFFESAKCLQMYSFAFKMLKTMKPFDCYGILRRLRSRLAIQMSNGLGYIPPPKKSPEDDFCF
jgi:hypothetical protein